MNNHVTYENPENVKMTAAQARMTDAIVEQHIGNSDYVFHTASVRVYKYFVSINFYYYKKEYENNPYLARSKHFMIGPRGAFKKATLNIGALTKTRDITKIAVHYVRAED